MPPPPRQAFLSAGANLGDRAATLRAATEELRALAGITAVESSAIYETAPIGVVNQPMFLNLVLGLETTLSPEELLEAARQVEQRHGRIRNERWGPRTLDLDLLCFEGEERNSPVLQLPHPRMLSRAFVVVPLREVLELARFQRASWNALRLALAAAPAEGQVRRCA